MAVFLITFRIAEDATFLDRRDDLHQAIKSIASGRWWADATDAIWFVESSRSMDEVSTALSSAIRPDSDLVFVSMADVWESRVLGANPPGLPSAFFWVPEGA